ncbi:MAG: hypothetical protein IPP40_04730 [bacterium]|nr:hypothetical protein [bacterium]
MLTRSEVAELSVIRYYYHDYEYKTCSIERCIGDLRGEKARGWELRRPDTDLCRAEQFSTTSLVAWKSLGFPCVVVGHADGIAISNYLIYTLFLMK